MCVCGVVPEGDRSPSRFVYLFGTHTHTDILWKNTNIYLLIELDMGRILSSRKKTNISTYVLNLKRRIKLVKLNMGRIYSSWKRVNIFNIN